MLRVVTVSTITRTRAPNVGRHSTRASGRAAYQGQPPGRRAKLAHPITAAPRSMWRGPATRVETSSTMMIRTEISSAWVSRSDAGPSTLVRTRVSSSPDGLHDEYSRPDSRTPTNVGASDPERCERERKERQDRDTAASDSDEHTGPGVCVSPQHPQEERREDSGQVLDGHGQSQRHSGHISPAPDRGIAGEQDEKDHDGVDVAITPELDQGDRTPQPTRYCRPPQRRHQSPRQRKDQHRRAPGCGDHRDLDQHLSRVGVRTGGHHDQPLELGPDRAVR